MAVRLSHSAISDFRRCGRYYKLKRVDKFKPDRESHSLQAGSILHTCYYFAHANPVKQKDHWRMHWELTGRVDTQRALAMYDSLWAADTRGLRAEDYPHFATLIQDQKPWGEIEFRSGQLKHLGKG
jgi:hypothetical protein